MSKELMHPESIDFYPFAYALFNENLTKHCWYCLVEKDNVNTLSRCSGCHTAWFCNSECSRLGWKDHISECKALKTSDSDQIPDIEIRLLGRIVTRYKFIKQGKDVKFEDFYFNRTSKRSIMEIWHHTAEIKNDHRAMAKFNAIYEKLAKFYGQKAMIPKEEVFELHCRDFINRHAISDKAYLNEIGKGLYLDLCEYDHSCRPNAIYVYKGFVATLRALNGKTNLLDTTNTHYCYIDMLVCKQQRKKLLKDTWYFNCQCERCLDDTEHLLTSMLCPNCIVNNDKKVPVQLWGSEQKEEIVCKECSEVVGKGPVMEALKAMRFIDDVLERREVELMSKKMAAEFLEGLLARYARLLPTINIYYAKIVQSLISYTELSDIAKLLDLHRMAEATVRLCVPENHPARCCLLKDMGYFYHKLQNFPMAIKYYREALDGLTFSMTSSHSMTRDVKRLLIETEIAAIRIAEAKNADIEKENVATNKLKQVNDKPISNEVINNEANCEIVDVTRDEVSKVNLEKEKKPTDVVETKETVFVKDDTPSTVNDDEFPLMDMIPENLKGPKKVLKTQDSLTAMMSELTNNNTLVEDTDDEFPLLDLIPPEQRQHIPEPIPVEMQDELYKMHREEIDDMPGLVGDEEKQGQ
uniref:MYND-type domain-containing protein n=1 Tax=Rhabditophanes sp. KR3021 TaxID=114890 RepID=A0AC35TKF2_9BILA